MISKIDQFLKNEIERLQREDVYRSLRMIEGPLDSTVIIDGQEVIILSSNNYLGLATHPLLKKEAVSVIWRLGVGTGASRLISGNMRIHEELEKRIAGFKKCEDAIYFSSGYMANIGLITSLAGEGDLIISDELNHASIIDGCRLSKAETRVFPHRNIDSLRKILLNDNMNSYRNGYKKRIIITDGIFSMDGDIAPLAEILEVAKVFDSFVIVDDAHATGVLGDNGNGTAEYFGLKDENLIQMGTFSKALGTMGGYVSGSSLLIDYLKNKARSFIYSTSPPPSICASSIAAIDIIENEPEIRKRLWRNINRLKRGLDDLGFNTIDSQTQIVPLLIGDISLTRNFTNLIFERGIYAPLIRPPTVPEGMSRIRLSLMATHTDEQINRVLSVFEDVGRRLRVI